jgi:hypothetical protein
MGPIEELYRDFCERIARECETEANRYEEHPDLRDADRQYVSSLREKARRLQQEIRRLNEQYSERAG